MRKNRRKVEQSVWMPVTGTFIHGLHNFPVIDKTGKTGYTLYTVQPGEQRPPVPEIRYSRGDGAHRAFICMAALYKWR